MPEAGERLRPFLSSLNSGGCAFFFLAFDGMLASLICSSIRRKRRSMFFRQLYESKLAQYSYIIGCQVTGEALVVDPLRDIGQYIRLAQEAGLRITHVTETHIHADFLSGARALAEAVGARLLLSDAGDAAWQYAFPHEGLQEGDRFMVGNVCIEVLHTPGHTPEHLSFLVVDTPAGDAPGMILTGDFVFVGDVGRPDLLDLVSPEPGGSEEMARRMFASLHKFRALPDHLLVWPGHGAGSACGRSLGASPASTVGYEKITNWALRETDEEAFVLRLLTEQPLPPRYFRNMKLWNRSGEKPGGAVSAPRRLSIQELETLRGQGVALVDARGKLAFAEGHIPGSTTSRTVRCSSPGRDGFWTRISRLSSLPRSRPQSISLLRFIASAWTGSRGISLISTIGCRWAMNWRICLR